MKVLFDDYLLILVSKLLRWNQKSKIDPNARQNFLWQFKSFLLEESLKFASLGQNTNSSRQKEDTSSKASISFTVFDSERETMQTRYLALEYLVSRIRSSS